MMEKVLGFSGRVTDVQRYRRMVLIKEKIKTFSGGGRAGPEAAMKILKSCFDPRQMSREQKLFGVFVVIDQSHGHKLHGQKQSYGHNFRGQVFSYDREKIKAITNILYSIDNVLVL